MNHSTANHLDGLFEQSHPCYVQIENLRNIRRPRSLSPGLQKSQANKNDQTGKTHKLESLVGERLLAETLQWVRPEIRQWPAVLFPCARHETVWSFIRRQVLVRRTPLIEQCIVIELLETRFCAGLALHGNSPCDTARKEEESTEPVSHHGDYAGNPVDEHRD